MGTEDFKKLLENYVENEDIVITNARDFWEKAPITKDLILNKGLHILLKKDDLETLNNNLNKASAEDKFYIIQEFCADIDMPNTKLIENILKNKYKNTISKTKRYFSK